MKVITLNDNPSYFNIFTSTLYSEWAPLYKRVNGIRSLREMREMYKELYKNGAVTLLFVDPELKGSYTFFQSGGRIYLCDVFVIKESRGNGLGKTIVEHAIENVHKYYPYCNRIYVESYNNTVIFYLKLGFTPINRSQNDDRHLLAKNVPNNSWGAWICYTIIVLIFLLFLWWILDK